MLWRAFPCVLGLVFASALVALAVDGHGAQPRSAAILDFELIDDMAEWERPEVKQAQEQRLVLITQELKRLLHERGLYRVVDNAPAADLIERERALQDLRNCNGCELDIARALGADVVFVTWVQKVSNLILNVNVEARDVATGARLFTRSVDLRGNTDESWLRGIRALVRNAEEAGQHLK